MTKIIIGKWINKRDVECVKKVLPPLTRQSYLHLFLVNNAYLIFVRVVGMIRQDAFTHQPRHFYFGNLDARTSTFSIAGGFANSSSAKYYNSSMTSIFLKI